MKVNMRTRKARLWKLGKVHALILVKLSKKSDSKRERGAFGEQQTGDDEEDENARWEITLQIIQSIRRLVRCLSWSFLRWNNASLDSENNFKLLQDKHLKVKYKNTSCLSSQEQELVELSLLEGKEQQWWWVSEAASPAAQTGQQTSIRGIMPLHWCAVPMWVPMPQVVCPIVSKADSKGVEIELVGQCSLQFVLEFR